MAVVYVGVLVLNERYNLLSADRFVSPVAKVAAYAWLGLFLFGIALLVTGAALHTPTPKELAATPFYRLFALHWILIIFLLVWWLLTGRPNLLDFFNLRVKEPLDAIVKVLTGLTAGFGGWLLTIILALLVGLILTATGVMPKNPQPSPMIGYMARLALWKKIAIVFSAMTVEEAFFRGWLQKRVGLLASTILFAVAHSGLGQPLLLIGVFIISLIIGFTFYRTKNLIPCIIAHGVFDAIQLFVILPVVFKMMGMGS
jgi:membrane protease YdiL (CAAX protease family)